MIGQLENLMPVKLFIPRHLDTGSIVVDVYINKNSIQNILIYLWVSINVMKTDIMPRIDLQGLLRRTLIVI